MDMYLSGKFYPKKLTARKYLKMLKLPNFCFPCIERLIFSHIKFNLLLVNWHGRIYLGQQYAKEITQKSENYG